MREGVIIDENLCGGCGLCILACPAGCLLLGDGFDAKGYHPILYSGDGCRLDGLCVDACPRPGAIALRGRSLDERAAG